MSITPPALEPILDVADTPQNIRGNLARSWSSGVVAQTFFDKTLAWFNNRTYAPPGKEPIIPADILPEPPEVSGGRRGQRVWTLYDIERLAFHLFHHPRYRGYDAAALYRTLDVVYAVARNQGLLPRDVDPLAPLRSAPRPWPVGKQPQPKTKPSAVGRRPQQAKKAKTDSARLEQPTLQEAIEDNLRQ